MQKLAGLIFYLLKKYLCLFDIKYSGVKVVFSCSRQRGHLQSSLVVANCQMLLSTFRAYKRKSGLAMILSHRKSLFKNSSIAIQRYSMIWVPFLVWS